MANELIKQNYKDIADAIRSKTGKNGLMTAEEMPVEINTLIFPSGNKPITTTSQVNVAAFATAQISDNNLGAENIKKDVTILGVVGTLEGGSGDLDELMQETF